MSEREKSALYPNATWGDCMDFIRKVSTFNLKAVSYAEVAKKYGLASTSTKSFTSKISSCKQFGLITTASGNTIQLSEVSKRILFPTGADTQQIELQCFAQPPLYAKIVELFDGKALPTLEILSNILMNEHRITRSAKDAAAKCFLDSAEQLGLIQGGVLCYEDQLNGAPASKADSKSYSEEKDDALTTSSVPYVSVPSVPLPTDDADYITQSIPCKSGKVAKIVIPVDASEDDLFLIHDMLNVVLRRKFKLTLEG